MECLCGCGGLPKAGQYIRGHYARVYYFASMKICPVCGTEKKYMESHKRWRCYKCLGAKEQERRDRDPNYRRLLDQRMYHKRRQMVLDYLKTHSCVDCGESDIVVLQFDHVRGKKIDSVCALVGRKRPLVKILAEIKKCDVRCANCHVRRTAKQHKWFKLTSV